MLASPRLRHVPSKSRRLYVIAGHIQAEAGIVSGMPFRHVEIVVVTAHNTLWPDDCCRLPSRRCLRRHKKGGITAATLPRRHCYVRQNTARR